MKPIVSFDVDMTLLDHKDFQIPASALKAIEKLRENYHIVIATGRDMDSVFGRAIMDQVRPDAVIHLNGTKVSVGGQVIHESCFDKDLLKQVLAFMARTPYSIGATISEVDYYVNPQVVRERELKLWGQCGRRFQAAEKLEDLDVRTLFFIGNEDGAKALTKEFPQLKVHLFADKWGGDVVEAGYSKAEGLVRLCEYFNTPITRSVAFGDSMNDYDIIKAAGTGIAMGNAMEALKEAADYVTDPIDRDGIWKACVHFGMIEREGQWQSILT